MKPWELKQAIKERADKEAWYEFWQNLEPSKLIELKKVEIKRNSIWMWNIIRQALAELKP